MSKSRIFGWILLIYLFATMGGGGFAAVTQSTYVYEKDQSGGVPPGVQFALREINAAGKIAAASIEVDVKDSTGNTPPQYKVAVESAKTAGLPALIVQAGDKVVKTVSAPETTEQVFEATGHE